MLTRAAFEARWDGRTRLHGPSRQSKRPDQPLRHLMVRDRDPQISPPDRRSVSLLVLPAAVRADLAAVLPGRHRQDARASQREHARRPDHRPRRDIGLRDTAGNAADLSVRAHHQSHRCRTRRAAVPASAGAAVRLFPGAAGRRLRRPRPRAGKYPQFPDRFGADARDRRVLHRRVSGRHVRVFAVPDLDRDRRACRSTSRSPPA